MRAGIVVNVTRADRRRLEAIVSDRSARQKHVWRAQIILATADGCGTTEIMRRSGKAKPVVWRWQARFMAQGVDGLLRDKTRRPGKPPLPATTVQKVIDLVTGPPPGETTQWTGRMLAKTVGISLRSVQRILEAHKLVPHRVRASSFRTIRSSLRNSGTWSVSTSILPPTRSSSRLTKKAKSRPSTAPSRDCR
jgi:transposase